MAEKNSKSAAVFIDRDGTIIHEKLYLNKVKDIKIFSGAPEAMKALKNAGFKLVMVTNQSGIGRGYFTEKKLQQIHKALQKKLRKYGAAFDAIYYCPHHPDTPCSCRKPNLGMIEKAKKRFNLDLIKSYVIGDKIQDYLLAKNMGGRGVFVLTGHGNEEYEKLKKSGWKIKPEIVEKSFVKAAERIISEKQEN